MSTNVGPRTRVLGRGRSREPEAPSGRSAVIVPGYPGQPSGAELARQAALGIRPRKDHVELARALDADIIDPSYMAEQASRVGRAPASRRHLAVLVTTDNYPADTAHQRWYSGSIRMSRTMAARVACSAWDESANHD